MSEKSPRPISDWKVIALTGYTMIGMTFGVAGVWAAVAKIDKAVIATGVVANEMNRKTVQHFEGGIVKDILIKEGDHVEAGQVLFRMEPIQAQANSDLLRNQYDSARALEARLMAERDRAKAITWPAEFDQRRNEPVLSHIITDQVKQFEERQASLDGQTSILEARVKQLETEIIGIQTEKSSSEKQVDYINQELVSLRELAAKKLVPTARVFAMERERTRLEGVIGRAVADSAKSQGSIGEIRIQVQQLVQKFQEDVASSLLEARQKVANSRERLAIAQDVLKRIEIAAPRSGAIQNLKVFTKGQVLRPGEAMLDIAPDDEPLVVNAQFATTDVDNIHAGMDVEIRFPAFHSRTIPVIMGKLQSVSHDRLFDESTRQYYFLGVISMNRTDVPEEYRVRVRPGMPAEVIASAGERTVMSYLVSPLSGTLRKSFREE